MVEALDRFLDRLKNTPIRALVTDYDGTLCASHERNTGIGVDIAGFLHALLSEGLTVGIATGRGGSAHEDLRNTIQPMYWDKVLLGLHNGADILPLSEEYTEVFRGHNLHLSHIRSALQPLISRLPVDISQNMWQLSLRPSTPINLEQLRRSVVELLYDVAPPFQVRRSAHSIDVIDASKSKAVMPQALKRFASVDETTILRIGDLGDWGGNDFDLLNEGLSLSVDRVSSRLNSCWNLGLPGSKGTTTTIHYLRALRPVGEVFQFQTSLLTRHGLRPKL